MRMRDSRVLRKLRGGEVVLSFKMGFSCMRVVDIVGLAGFDCVWLCMEHTPGDWSEIERLVFAAKANDMDAMVRVSKGSYSDMLRPLELDASGIMVPHVMNGDEARKIARTTRFHPLGMRPADGGSSDGRYCSVPFTEYIKQANEQRFVCVQIEDVEAMEHIEDICSVDGIDMIFFGPGDFSQSLGTPGDFSNPAIAEARELVAETALKFGKFPATTGSPDTLSNLVEMGYRYVNLGADVVGLGNYCADLIGKASSKVMNLPKYYGK